MLPLLSADPWRVFAVNQADWQPAAARRKPQGGRRAADLLPPLTDPTKKTLVLDLDETLIHTAREPHVERARELTREVHTAAAAGHHPEDGNARRRFATV